MHHGVSPAQLQHSRSSQTTVVLKPLSGNAGRVWSLVSLPLLLSNSLFPSILPSSTCPPSILYPSIHRSSLNSPVNKTCYSKQSLWLWALWWKHWTGLVPIHQGHHKPVISHHSPSLTQSTQWQAPHSSHSQQATNQDPHSCDTEECSTRHTGIFLKCTRM